MVPTRKTVLEIVSMVVHRSHKKMKLQIQKLIFCERWFSPESILEILSMVVHRKKIKKAWAIKKLFLPHKTISTFKNPKGRINDDSQEINKESIKNQKVFFLQKIKFT